MVRRFDSPTGIMDERDDGDYVTYEAYAALKDKLARLVEAVKKHKKHIWGNAWAEHDADQELYDVLNDVEGK